MTLNKKNLFLGVVLGSLGISLYNSIKNYKEKSKYIKTKLNHPTNSTNLPETAKIDDNIIDYIHQLKKQTNVLEKKLNKFKK